MKNLKISVVVPVLNDARGLAHTLDSLMTQKSDRPKHEIIVVDNGSTDQTGQVIQDYATRFPSKIKGTSENRTQSSYAARNKGVLISDGDIIIFIDSNVTVGNTFFGQVNTFFKSGVQYLGCNVAVSFDQKNLAGKYNFLSGFNIKKNLEREGFVQTCCLAVAREVIATVGVFDPRLLSGGDLEFGNRVKANGFTLSFAPNIVVNHPARDSIRALLKKSFRIGRGVSQLASYYPDRYSFMERSWYSLRFFLPPLPHSFQAKIGLRPGYSISKKELIEFFMIMWLNKMAKHTGYLCECFFHRFHSKL